MTNPLSFLIEIALTLKNFFNVINDFLFTEVDIPFVGQLSLWIIFGGVGLVVILGVRVVKMFI